MKKTPEEIAKAAAEASEELDALQKSLDGEEKKEETDIDALQKAIDESEEALKKSDEEEDDKEGDDKGEDEKEEMEKSESENDDLAELVKASEAFESLEKSVRESDEKLSSRIDSLEKSLVTAITLLTKQARVIASLTKSVQEGMKTNGAAPLKKSQAQLGGGEEGNDGKEKLAKSKTEAREILIKAVQDKKEDARILSVFETYGLDRIVDQLSAETRSALGV